jgi:hypothetical protein
MAIFFALSIEPKPWHFDRPIIAARPRGDHPNALGILDRETEEWWQPDWEEARAALPIRWRIAWDRCAKRAMASIMNENGDTYAFLCTLRNNRGDPFASIRFHAYRFYSKPVPKLVRVHPDML